MTSNIVRRTHAWGVDVGSRQWSGSTKGYKKHQLSPGAWGRHHWPTTCSRGCLSSTFWSSSASMPVSHTIFSLIRKDYETGGRRKRPKKTNINFPKVDERWRRSQTNQRKGLFAIHSLGSCQRSHSSRSMFSFLLVTCEAKSINQEKEKNEKNAINGLSH